jgi:hypothetical protein
MPVRMANFQKHSLQSSLHAASPKRSDVARVPERGPDHIRNSNHTAQCYEGECAGIQGNKICVAYHAMQLRENMLQVLRGGEITPSF